MDEINPIYKQLAAKINCKHSKYMPGILQRLINEEQARIILELPASSEEIAAKLGLDKNRVESHIKELYEKGAVLPTKKGYQFVRSAEQFHDTQTNPRFDEALGKDYFQLWEAFINEEMNKELTAKVVPSGQPISRIIPSWKAIKDMPGVQPFEDIREALKASRDNLALLHCPCKRLSPSRTCDVPIESCINLGRGAQYNIARGTGKKLTLKEALDFLNEIEKYPVIHISPNVQAVNVLICNCHKDCCSELLRAFNQSEYKVSDLIARSRFEAVSDPDKCIGCGTCAKMCQFGAAQMRYAPEFNESRTYTDKEKCMGCGLCVVNCPVGARKLKLVRPEEYIPKELSIKVG